MNDNLHTFKGMDILQAMDYVNEVLTSIVGNQFASGSGNNRIQSYSELLKRVV